MLTVICNNSQTSCSFLVTSHRKTGRSHGGGGGGGLRDGACDLRSHLHNVMSLRPFWKLGLPPAIFMTDD